MTHRLDVESIWIDDEGCIVVWAVAFPQPRPAVVATTRRQGRDMKGVHLGPGGGAEGDVVALPRSFLVGNDKVGLAPDALAVSLGRPAR